MSEKGPQRDEEEVPVPGEGVIRFDLAYRRTEPRDWPWLPRLDGWRAVLRRLGLVGRDPSRYGGYGFGNLSHRIDLGPADARRNGFVISGTQTGGREHLGPEGWSHVTDWDLDDFRLVAEGPCEPSSESLTHATLYDLDDEVHCIVHVHSPEIWHHRRLDLPRTSAGIEYGTAEMAREVRSLYALGLSDVGVFVMDGHEDGVVALGGDPDDACHRLLTVLSRVLGSED